MVLAIGDRIDPMPSGGTTTAGLTGKSVTFSPPLPDADYSVNIMLVDRSGGQLGEWWVPAATRTANGFIFHNEGAAGLLVRWSVQRY